MSSNDVAGEIRLRGRDPLFPYDASAEHRSIRFVTFRVLHKDGEFVYPEDFDADRMRCWDDVERLLGPGMYRAFGKDEHRRVVTMYPSPDVGWVVILPEQEPCLRPAATTARVSSFLRRPFPRRLRARRAWRSGN
jgi:hypothetical protein